MSSELVYAMQDAKGKIHFAEHGGEHRDYHLGSAKLALQLGIDAARAALPGQAASETAAT